MKYILSIDQGTTGTTACLVNAKTFEFVGKVNKEFPQIFPHPSWVEHNLNDIWSSVESTVGEVLKKFNIDSSNIISIGITNQRETTCAFDINGNPLANAIVWQDRRTTNFCNELTGRGLKENIKNKTGLTIDPYFSASKMNWLLKNNAIVGQAAREKKLHFGTIDTFLLYKLSGTKSYKTDASNASRTMLMNLSDCLWDSDLLKLFEIDSSMLPTIEDSFGMFGKTNGLSFLPDGIPITGILGDQQSALFGQVGISAGDMKCTYGTGAFVLLNTGENLTYSNSGLLTTVEYKYRNKTIYALEGSSYIAGAAVQWLRDNLKIIQKSSEVENLARQVNNLSELESVLFFPFFTGIGSPYWNSEARASILGLTRDTSRPHIAFACLEGIALSINDLLETMREDTGLPILNLKVDGGAVENSLLMELQASISETKIIRPKIIETTAFGAALAAAVGAGIVNIEDLSKLWQKDKEFSSNQEHKVYLQKKKTLWSKMIKRVYLKE